MAQADPGEQALPSEVTVTGKRIPGSVIGAVEPVAVLDPQALEALGATSLSDLLKKGEGADQFGKRWRTGHAAQRAAGIGFFRVPVAAL
jgi:outer membrane cobalamin receptor